MRNVALIIPGLDDRIALMQFVTRNWQKQHGIEVHVHKFGWKDKTSDFKQRLNPVINKIDELTDKSNAKLTLIGTSAGGSACFNTYYSRPDKIHKVINICARLYKGENVHPSLEKAAASSKAFYESVVNCEKGIANLNQNDLNKILTIRPIYDEIVPVKTMIIEGATNIQIPTIEHMLSISLALTVFRSKTLLFMNNN